MEVCVDILDLIDGTLADCEISEDAARHVPQAARTFTPPEDAGWEVIDAFTRADAIDAGILVPVPGDLAGQAGFRYPVALTSAAWDDCVAWSDAVNHRKPVIQDETGRLWDVLWVASRAVAAARGRDRGRVLFRVHRVPRSGRASRPRPVTLAVCCGPGDEGEPVITIMQPQED
jgi:hypothetical protein